MGQILFKIGMKGKTFDSFFGIIKTMFSSLVLPGIIIYALATVLWLYIISKIPINRVYPIQALAYPMMLVLAKYLFNENITVTRWIGVGTILIGVVVVSR